MARRAGADIETSLRSANTGSRKSWEKLGKLSSHRHCFVWHSLDQCGSGRTCVNTCHIHSTSMHMAIDSQSPLWLASRLFQGNMCAGMARFSGTHAQVHPVVKGSTATGTARANSLELSSNLQPYTKMYEKRREKAYHETWTASPALVYLCISRANAASLVRSADLTRRGQISPNRLLEHGFTRRQQHSGSLTNAMRTGSRLTHSQQFSSPAGSCPGMTDLAHSSRSSLGHRMPRI